MNNIHIPDMVRFLTIGRNQNQKLCYLHLLMDEASPLKTQKPWIIEVTFSKSKSEKNVKLDFHIKFWMSFKKVTAELN